MQRKFVLSNSSGFYSKIKSYTLDAFVYGYVMFSVYVLFFSKLDSNHDDKLLIYTKSFIIFILIGFLINVVFRSFSNDSLGEFLFPEKISKPEYDLEISWYKIPRNWQIILGLFFTIYFGHILAQVNFKSLLDRDSIFYAARMFRELAKPDWSVLDSVVSKTIETIYMAFMATFMAVPIAFALSFASAKNIMGGSYLSIAIYSFLKLIFNIMRSIEPVLWAIIFSIWVEVGPFAGMLALMVHSIVSLAKQFAELIECVEDGPIEGIKSTGASFLQTIWFAVVPQVTLPFISFTVYRWDINIRMATIIGFVGGGGVGQVLLQYQLQSQWAKVGCIILVIAFVVWIMDLLSARVREVLK